MKKHSFYDLFDVASLQKLTDSLAVTLQVSIAVRSPQGEYYTQNSEYCDFCQKFITSSAVGKKRCEQSDIRMCAYGEISPYIHHCPVSGLIDTSIKIVVEGLHVASILVGQIRLEGDELTEEEYRENARSLGVDEDEYLESLRKIPVKTQAQFQNILNTITLIAEQLSQLGYQALQLKTMLNTMKSKELLHQQELNVLSELADKDPLTGLYNRRKFEKTLREYADAGCTPLCIISADANYLKITNDLFGHENGDVILKSIARIMSELAKKDWLVARCGGDEFRVILPNTRLETALDYCRRVNRNCQKDKTLAIPLSVALSAAEWDPEHETLENCFDRADEKMYQNKVVIKRQHHLPNYIMERLYDRQILNREVVELSQQIVYDFALYLGQTTAQADHLRTAIHYEDIGMAKLPEYFMIRGLSRTPEEALQIKQHVVHSNMMARQFENLYQVADIILYTHENWDGNGYPKQLTGCHIPLESRILRIVNNYTYWTVSTLVGTNLTKEEAKQKLIRESGKMYDPELVEKFLKFIKKYKY